MKQILLFVISFCLMSLISCQKKQYATFQNSSQTDYAHSIEKTEIKASDDIPASEVILPGAPTESIYANSTNVTGIEAKTITISEKPNIAEPKKLEPNTAVKKKTTLIQKVKAIQQIKKLSKQVSKKSAVTANPESSADDTLAIISLILGLFGVTLLIFGVWVGFLLGLGAMITGIISLKSTSKRVMAVLGIVLGAGVLILGIIAVIFITSLISNL
ncbi:DUF4190 domain-containing protein [Emticicia soli]|uniref:DUF4190 domain-containing protein n=1 Tax=Emticicia soli TaxID=2027878 RepID=A0ABW5JF33_9BACT